MATSIRKTIRNGTAEQTADFKIQPASDASGAYVEVFAIDGGGGGGGGGGEVTQGTTPWVVSGAVTANGGTNLNTSLLALESGGNLAALVGEIGSTSDTAPASDTGTASLNGRLQRLAQRLSALISLIPSALTGSGNFKVALVESTATQAVSGSVTANAGTSLNTSALALETGGNLATLAGAVSAAKVQTVVATALPAGTNTIGGVYSAPTSSSSLAITPGSSSALEGGHVLKASAGNLYSLYLTTTTVAGFLMTFNASSVPSDGAVTPVECIVVPAGSTCSISNSGSPPDAYSTGIVAVFSTTGPFTKTASATAFFKWRVQ